MAGPANTLRPGKLSLGEFRERFIHTREESLPERPIGSVTSRRCPWDSHSSRPIFEVVAMVTIKGPNIGV